MFNKLNLGSLVFFFSELNFRKRQFFAYLLVGFFGIFAEAFGIGMIVPILDFIRLNGDVETLVASNKLWALTNQMVVSSGLTLDLFLLLVVFVLAIFLRQIFDYSYALMMVSLKNELLHTLRGKLFFILQSISFTKAQQKTSGEYINLLDFQTEQVSNILPTYFRLFKTCSTFLTYAIALVYSAPSFVLLAICQFALIMLPLGTFIRKSKQSSTEIIRQRAVVTDYFAENYLAMRVVRLFNLQQHQSYEFTEISNIYVNELRRLSEIQLKPPFFFGIAIAIAIATQVFIGHTFLDVSATTLTFFILVILRLAPTSLSIMSYANNLAVQLPNLAHVREAMAQVKVENKNKHKNLKSISKINSISLNDVTFIYPGTSAPVIKSFSETFSEGTFNVIYGPSGVGKSTLLDLVSKLVSPTNGSIRYNGIDIRNFDEGKIHNLISYSSQEAFIFRGSLTENITLGSRFDSNLFKKTSEICQISDLVQDENRKKQGRDQISRHSLSGGQKQRISLARSLYRMPNVLILDEPTSAVDEAVEKKIIKGLKEYTVSNNIITLLVSHNSAHHRLADKIIRLKN